MKRITVDLIMSLDPCEEYSRDRITKLFSGRKSVALKTVLKTDKIQHNDKLWLLLRTQFIPENDLHELACQFAEHVLPIFETEYSDDKRPRLAIEAKRKWLQGEITTNELKAAAWAARDAAWDAARDAKAAPWDAAWDAAWAAAWAAKAAAGAAWDAPWAARAAAGNAAEAARDAWDAEEQWQIKQIVNVIEMEN